MRFYRSIEFIVSISVRLNITQNHWHITESSLTLLFLFIPWFSWGTTKNPQKSYLHTDFSCNQLFKSQVVLCLLSHLDAGDYPSSPLLIKQHCHKRKSSAVEDIPTLRDYNSDLSILLPLPLLFSLSLFPSLWSEENGWWVESNRGFLISQWLCETQ